MPSCIVDSDSKLAVNEGELPEYTSEQWLTSSEAKPDAAAYLVTDGAKQGLEHCCGYAGGAFP